VTNSPVRRPGNGSRHLTIQPQVGLEAIPASDDRSCPWRDQPGREHALPDGVARI